MEQNYRNNSNRNNFDDARRQKAKNFRMNINRDDLAVGEQYRHQRGIEEPIRFSLNSFSDDDVRMQMEKDSQVYAKEMKREKKRTQRLIDKQNGRVFRFIWWGSVIMVGLVLGIFLMSFVNDVLAIGRSEEKTVTIRIPENPTIEQISQELGDKGVINECGFFTIYANLTSNASYFSQGTYEIKTNMDYEAIINYIQSMSNRTDTVKVMIPEGESVLEIANRLKKEKVLKSTDRFLELCNSDYFDEDYSFVRKIKNDSDRYYKLEGYLFPDTYECYVNEKPELTITRMLNAYEMRTTQKQFVEGYKKPVNIASIYKNSEYKSMYTMDEIMTIASIIQAEAANKDDMYYISSIIHNRLVEDINTGVWALGMDSTAYYPYKNKNDVPEDIRDTFSSTYNTYELRGLPAGPICNPGMEAILAALYPNDTDYLYFCHSEEGEPYYASTFYEHNIHLEQLGYIE